MEQCKIQKICRTPSLECMLCTDRDVCEIAECNVKECLFRDSYNCPGIGECQY